MLPTIYDVYQRMRDTVYDVLNLHVFCGKRHFLENNENCCHGCCHSSSGLGLFSMVCGLASNGVNKMLPN
jgi:hypothetical protein